MKLSVDTVEKACEALKNSGIVNENGEYDKEFKGYISAFGVAVVQMGLYPALLIYEDKSANTGAKRYLLANALRCYLYSKHNLSYPEVNRKKNIKYKKENANKTIILDKNLSDWYEGFRADNRKLMQRHVNDALVALKLALRIYAPKSEQKEKKENSNEQ